MNDLVFQFLEKVLLLHAGIRTFKAIKSESKTDDTQWLTFWLIVAIFDFVTMITDLLEFAIPLYNEIKIAFIVFIGIGGGASIIFPLLEPILYEGVRAADEAGVEKVAGMVSDTVNAFGNRNSKTD